MSVLELGAGPRLGEQRERYQAALDAIYVGYQSHYADSSGDADLALLEGDRRYADGLAQLAELGDTFAISQLADTISLLALANARKEREIETLLWEAIADIVANGTNSQYEEAKDLLRRGDAAGSAELLVARKGRPPLDD